MVQAGGPIFSFFLLPLYYLVQAGGPIFSFLLPIFDRNLFFTIFIQFYQSRPVSGVVGHISSF